jgi:hypothetical protein
MNPDDSQHGQMFKNINTSLCEQFFSFLTKFRSSLRGFNYPTSTLFTLLLFHLKNSHTTGIRTNAFGLGRCYFANKIRPHFLSPCIFESVRFDLDQQQNKRKEKESDEELNEGKLNEEESNEELDEGKPDEEELDEEESNEELDEGKPDEEELDEEELDEKELDEEELDEEELNEEELNEEESDE